MTALTMSSGFETFDANKEHGKREDQVDPSSMASVLTPALLELSQIFKKYSYDIRIAGGAVRDILMERTPHDVDLATTATPEQMKSMFIAENVRMINNRGESHGTITPRICEENFEVTTLRIDKVTDGRHAQVDFTTDWKLDAGRRDLTINAMFLGLNGEIYDYFDGRADLKEHRIRFVGDARTRIQEDYLRILRYFRFFGRFSKHSNQHDEDTLNAIKENVKGLANISGERIWMELNKILIGGHAPDVVEVMKKCDVLQYCGFPSDPSVDEFRSLYNQVVKEHGKCILHPAACVACLLESEAQVEAFFKRARISRFELELMNYIIREKRTIAERDEDDLQFFQKRFLLDSSKVPKMKLILEEVMRAFRVCESTIDEFKAWTPPRFPVRGNNLCTQWDVKGPNLGKCMQALRELWIESGTKATEEELMSSDVQKKVFDKLFSER